jgi:hypothetical protein
MTYAAHPQDFARCAVPNAPSARNAVGNKPGILRRIVDAVRDSRQRQADREIAAFIARSGGRLTDDLERRMMRRISMPDRGMRD